MSKKILVVGGVAGGASTAARLRRLDESAEIIIFERDGHISFANCGLPYYLGGVIKERDNLFVQTPERMLAEFRIEVRIFNEVDSIDPAGKSVNVKSRERGVYQESYDYLVLAPGARPVRPPIPGIEHKNILSLRNVADTDAIKERLDQPKTRRAVVIGGGFVGVEMAENLRHKGLAVSLVEAQAHILAPFDDDMVPLLEREMEEKGVRLVLGDGVKAFLSREDGAVDVELGSGRVIPADLVLLAIGVSPDTAFLKDSGLTLGPRGHIVVDERMRTSDSSIYAVGDAVEIVDFVNGQKTAIPLAGPANRQGRIAADNIAGMDSRYRGAIGSSILKVFNLSAAATGGNERLLARLGKPYSVVYAHPQSHASYYPGASMLSLKLLFDDDGLILGAQGIGYEGVDKCIDIIAAVIKLKGKISDLTDLELCYAPPFSSAKAPVNILAYVAENKQNKLLKPITYNDYLKLDPQTIQIVDVRSAMEFELGHLEGAINIPLGELRQRLAELDREKRIVAYCKIGLRSYVASRMLMQNGYDACSIGGGMTSIEVARFKPSDKEPAQDMPPQQGSSSFEPGQSGNDGKTEAYLDARGIACPGPLMKVKAKMDTMAPGERLTVIASDPGFYTDVDAWCTSTSNKLLHREKDKFVTAVIQKTEGKTTLPDNATPVGSLAEHKTIVLFSNDMDKVLASLIIANGALAMNKKVTMFFTFWGLSVLRKPGKNVATKSVLEKMFGFMLPDRVSKLALSKMHMFGLGSGLMRKAMRDKGVPSVQELLENLQQGGANLVACQMSMDILGFRREELIDNISIGGVGYYLGESDKANMSLFI